MRLFSRHREPALSCGAYQLAPEGSWGRLREPDAAAAVPGLGGREHGSAFGGGQSAPRLQGSSRKVHVVPLEP